MLAQINQLVLGASGTLTDFKTEMYEGPGFKIEHGYWSRWTGAGQNGNRCFVPSQIFVTNTATVPIKMDVFVDLDDNGLIWDAQLCDSQNKWIDFGTLQASTRVVKNFNWGVVNLAGVPYTETFEVRFNLAPKVLINYQAFKPLHLGTSRVSTV